MGMGGQRHPPAALPLERNLVHIVTELVKIKVSLTSPFSTRTELSALYPQGISLVLLLEVEWTLRLLNGSEGKGHLKIPKELTRN